ncbi:Mediator of RNA polymerase II transcription subunit 21 [Kappamyces sp. JEL0680]|nr:Mediator of RNA polymerase II transcription subunit 21 [Kappamyces sp. JEL0680]
MTKETDRLSQLQECVSRLSELYFISIGALQRDAPLLELNPEIPVTAWTKEQVQSNWKGNQELARSAAKDIVHAAKVIDFLIDHLPGIQASEKEQIDQLEALEVENKKAEAELKEVIAMGNALVEKLKLALEAAVSAHESCVA